MCGRYSLLQIDTQIWDWLPVLEGYYDRLNIAPMSKVPAYRLGDDGIESFMAQWWLVPFFSKTRRYKWPTYIARAETVAQKPSFRNSFKRKRCLIPATAWYEFSPIDGQKKKIPVCIRRVDEKPVLFAGIWDEWTDEKTGEVLESCSIITTEANADVRDFNHRMPVVLNGKAPKEWLSNNAPAEQLLLLLKPSNEGTFKHYRVSAELNNSRNEGPNLMDPI